MPYFTTIIYTVIHTLATVCKKKLVMEHCFIDVRYLAAADALSCILASTVHYLYPVDTPST